MALKVINDKVITQFMQENSLTKTAFCKFCGIGHVTFDKIINDQSTLTLHPVFRVAKAMNIHVKELFKKDEI